MRATPVCACDCHWTAVADVEEAHQLDDGLALCRVLHAGELSPAPATDDPIAAVTACGRCQNEHCPALSTEAFKRANAPPHDPTAWKD